MINMEDLCLLVQDLYSMILDRQINHKEVGFQIKVAGSLCQVDVILDIQIVDGIIIRTYMLSHNNIRLQAKMTWMQEEQDGLHSKAKDIVSHETLYFEISLIHTLIEK